MIYDIANPSDAYTMKTDDEEAAVLACMFLGEGQYALTDERGEQVCPFFMFGGDPDTFMLKKYGRTLKAAIDAKRAEFADALDSVLIGSMEDRKDYEEAIALMTPENAATFEASRHDKRRTSMNNIGRRAKALAKHLRKPDATQDARELQAPRQVFGM